MQEKMTKRVSKLYRSKNINDTLNFAYNFSSILKPSDIICLNGDLGTGKTVLAKGIAKYFNLNTDIISPTFNILKIYNIDHHHIKNIYHYDLYRIYTEKDLYDIGFDEYIMRSDSIHIIEWPEIAKNLLPKDHYNINIRYDYSDPKKRIIEYEY